jgi:oxysterol-binding protein-related protein 8
MISQLRPGMDLTRVTLPTFVLEPKSMLERITNFMSHPELLLPISTFDDPEKRFIEVVRFYLSGFHILPPVIFPSHYSHADMMPGCQKTS